MHRVRRTMVTPDAYARAIVDGSLPAGAYHKAACQRFLRDLERQKNPGFPYRFDRDRAERACAFAGKLKHYKGEWAGQPIQLEPWQRFMTAQLFGWVHVETGHSRSLAA